MEGVSKNKKSMQSTLLGLSPLLWLELFFKPHLSIESSVYLSSTCSFFWNNERIQEWLREKEIKLFGSNIPKLFWNKLEFKPHLMIIDNSFMFKNHFFIQHTNSEVRGSNIYVGVFSSKERLLKAFGEIINVDILLQNPEHTFSFRPPYFCISFTKENPFSHTFVSVSNVIVKELKSMLLTVKNKKYEGL